MCKMRQEIISFNDTFKSINYLDYLVDLSKDYQNFREKKYSKLSLEILQRRFANSSLWLTHSATGALEMIAKAIAIQPGDEVILSSFTFVSTANAFVNFGAKPIFVDISEEDLNIDISQVEKEITDRTKAIIITHYGGHASDLNRLKQICHHHQIYLIEDAAMAYGNYFQEQPLGSVGDFGVISFDITKQISAIQGGLLLCNHPELIEKLDHIYHIGTNRTQFMDHALPYYEWVSEGSKFQMNEMNAVVLYDHLMNEEEIFKKRHQISEDYFEQLSFLKDFRVGMLNERFRNENLHLFYLILASEGERNKLIHYLKENKIEALFHYIPLHNSKKGLEFCDYPLKVTEMISKRLVRLPLHVRMTTADSSRIAQTISNYFTKNGRK